MPARRSAAAPPRPHAVPDAPPAHPAPHRPRPRAVAGRLRGPAGPARPRAARHRRTARGHRCPRPAHPPRRRRPAGHPPAQQRVCRVRARRAAHVHLVAGEGRPVRQGRAAGRAQPLFPRQHRRHVEQAEPVHAAGRTPDALRVLDPPAEHLVAAAEPQHPPAPPPVRQDVDVPAFLAQHGEVGDRGLGAGQDHEGAVPRQGRAPAQQQELHPGLGGQRVEVVEIADAGQHRHGDPQGGAGVARGRPEGGEQILRVLRRQAARRIGEGHQPQRRPAGALRDRVHPFREERGVAAHPVHQEAPDHRRILRRQHGLRAHEAGDHPAPVDVAHQHDRRARGAGEAHIGDVARAQVDLGGAARPLHQHEVGFRPQPREAVEDMGHEAGLHRLVFARPRRGEDAALHHHLGSGLALRLEQHGVHVDTGRHARRPRLEGLGAADLAPIRGDGGVVGHVLRLEGPHPQPAPREEPRQPGDEQRLAHRGAGALEHQGHRHQNSIPCCAFTPAAKWCFTSPISVTRSAASTSAGGALRPVATTCRPGRRARSAATTESVSR